MSRSISFVYQIFNCAVKRRRHFCASNLATVGTPERAPKLVIAFMPGECSSKRWRSEWRLAYFALHFASCYSANTRPDGRCAPSWMLQWTHASVDTAANEIVNTQYISCYPHVSCDCASSEPPITQKSTYHKKSTSVNEAYRNSFCIHSTLRGGSRLR